MPELAELLRERARELSRRAGLSRVPTPVLVAGFMLLSVGVVAALARWWPQPAPDVGVAAVTHSRARSAASGSVAATGGAAGGPIVAVDASASVVVHVVGAVRHPGVYTLAASARVQGAVECAGGLRADAAAAAVNLAAKVRDGEQIVVPTDAEVAAGRAPVVASGGGAAGAGGGSVSAGGTGALVNINTADATALDALPGVGPSTAAKIVADRQANGPFKSADDLGRVPGIGPKKLDTLKPLICVE